MRLSSKPPLNLLFSPKPDWEAALQTSFRRSRHAVRFEEFTPDSLAACDLAVPLTLNDTIFLAENTQFMARTRALIPSLGPILLCNNKQALNEHLIGHGFGKHIPRISGDIGFPYLLKKKTDNWGMNTHLVQDASSEKALLAALNSPDYFKQELIPGSEEYATHLVLHERRILCSLTIKHSFVRDAFVFGLNGLRPEFRTVTSCRHLNLFTDILNSIGFSGLCCIDYKIHNGSPAIFEINPRFGASLAPFFFSFLRHLPL